MTRTFTGCLLVLAALFLTLAVYAQQSITTHPAQTLTDDYRFSELTRQNPTYGKHQSISAVHYGPLVAFADNNTAAFLADFFDPRTGPVRGIFASDGRELGEDGTRIGDITLLQVRASEPYDLQINRLNEVSWIALIQAAQCGQAATCTALFVNERLTAVTFAGTPSAYALGDNGKITAPAGHAWITPAGGSIALAGMKGKKGAIFGSIMGEINKTLPVRIPGITQEVPWSRYPVTIGNTVGNGVPLPGTLPSVSGQSGQPVAQQKAPFEVMAQLPYCASPPGGGWPDEWSRNANAAGPIASERLEWVRGNYLSDLHPNVHRWIKKTYFSADCRPIFVSAAEYPGVTQELWTTAGMAASFDAAEGVYRLNGVPPVALPAANTPIEDGVRINRRCAMVVVVAFKRATDNESALVVGTPAKSGHCPTE